MINKYDCFLNAKSIFETEGGILHIIADNCSKETLLWLEQQGVNCMKTKRGNSGSFRFMLELIARERSKEDYVYLVEDDYIHCKGALNAIREGLEIADYVTVYDHPDKYSYRKNTDPQGRKGSPFNRKGLRKSVVYVTESCHWRETDSTTMTFACKVKTLLEDKAIWFEYTKTKNPCGFNAFVELTVRSFSDVRKLALAGKWRLTGKVISNVLLHKKKRKLISSLPGFSTHTEVQWLSPVRRWDELG